MNIILKNKLELTSGNTSITTPGDHTLEEVTVTLVEEKDHTFNHSAYPNGLIMLTVQKPTRIIVYSNWIFQQNEDGNYTMVKP